MDQDDKVAMQGSRRLYAWKLGSVDDPLDFRQICVLGCTGEVCVQSSSDSAARIVLNE